MRNINQDIKDQTYKRIYLLYGDEAYLRRQYKDRLKQGICGDDTMNYSVFRGKIRKRRKKSWQCLIRCRSLRTGGWL